MPKNMALLLNKLGKKKFKTRIKIVRVTCGERNSHIIFKDGGKRTQLLVRIYSPVTASFTLTTPPPLRFLGRINGFPFLKQTINLTKIYDFVLIRIMKIISILISFLWIESCFIPLFMQISIFQFAKSWCLLEIYICIWKYKIH